MTRLITEWIADIEHNIREQERDLKSKTGHDYTSLAAKAGGWSYGDIERASQEIKVAVVPVTTGQGIIGSFAQSVAAVTKTMGFRSYVTQHTDVNGMHEAYQHDADIVYLADDDRFISVNLNKKKMADNNVATAAGYIAALDGAIGSFVGKEVLLMGYGALGREFLKGLKKKGISVAVFDLDKERLGQASREEVTAIDSFARISSYRYIIDATSQGSWLHQGLLHPEAWIAAPGIPLSLNEGAQEIYSERLIHDPLQIGVAAMLGMTL
ncbi:3-methylornithyl-N6-L-lysine dehydrogenase PylD [Anoxybacterium hadale]|uniref:3-methylornithyl-N6-L-lysine dehydrogenase PylD n=1 Tax=Anoxybacterium hadale TaxID=3408580 RepID=A0ACD1A7G5_9FIRM|nr:3-methylornithyl-N6-L-lysine dehydrogenase PylD [Clostridiales bacterium]